VYPLLFFALMHSPLHPFLSHPKSQNNRRATLDVALKFPTKCVTTLTILTRPLKVETPLRHWMVSTQTIKIKAEAPYTLP